MCERGDTVKCNVLGRGVMIDRCIAPIINALNEVGLVTAESCCGHGETEGHILFYQDGKGRVRRENKTEEEEKGGKINYEFTKTC